MSKNIREIINKLDIIFYLLSLVDQEMITQIFQKFLRIYLNFDLNNFFLKFYENIKDYYLSR